MSPHSAQGLSLLYPTSGPSAGTGQKGHIESLLPFAKGNCVHRDAKPWLPGVRAVSPNLRMWVLCGRRALRNRGRGGWMERRKSIGGARRAL